MEVDTDMTHHQSPSGRRARVDTMIRDALETQTLSLVELFILVGSRGVSEPVALCVLAQMIQQGEVAYRDGGYVLIGAPASGLAGGAA